jgi:hypothetical protein
MTNGSSSFLSVCVTLCVTQTLLAQFKFVPMSTAPPGPSGSAVPGFLAMDNNGVGLGWLGGAPFMWSPLTGFKFVPGLFDGRGEISDTTPNGEYSVGSIWNNDLLTGIPVRWGSRELPPTPIAGFPPGWACFDVHCNSDATVVVGRMGKFTGPGKQLFIWRAGVRKNQGWEFITEFPLGMVDGVMDDLSADGTIGFGGGPNATLEGFSGLRWTKKGGLELIPDITGGVEDGILTACDASGFRASHWASPPEGKWLAAVWDPVNSWTLLGKLKPTDSGAAIKIDDSGFAGAGTSEFGTIEQGRTAIYWTARDGLRSVQDVLVNDYGLVQAAAWKLGDVDAISPNGRYMAGRGLNPQGKFETWWAEIRPFCYADCDNTSSPKGSGAGPPVLNIDDYICYQTKFILGDHLYADCDLNGTLDINDFICFQTKFVLGC